MDNELVIFKVLPDRTTPLNAYNLNHNFDVFKSQNEKTAEDLETTRQELENNITSKTKTLEDNITTKTEELENNITTKANQLSENITTATEDLTNQITQAKTELQTEIGEQIAKITTLQIEVVTELPTQDISKTTIYLIKPENLPQDMSINSVKKSFSANKLVVSPLETNSLSSLSVTEEDYYLACFWVNDNWTIVGSTTTDLTPYAKKTDIPTKLSQLENDENFLNAETDPSVPDYVKNISQENITSWTGKADKSEIPQNLTDLTDDMFNKEDSEETAKSNSSSNPEKIYFTVES